MMKKVMMSLLLTVLCCTAMCQTDFTWKITESSPGEVLLTVTGTMESDWHISMHMLKVERNDGITVHGALGESMNETAGGGCRVVYTQCFKVDDGARAYHLKGYLQYMACTDKMCLAPQTVEFEHSGTVTRTADEAKDEDADADKVLDEAAQTVVRDTIGTVTQTVRQPDFLDKKAWQPSVDELKALEDAAMNDNATTADGSAMGLLTLFLLAFGGGLLAILTPCVWPMIPLTVSFFMRQGEREGRKGVGIGGAMLYGACIVVIFITLGVALTMLFGANALNQLATNAVFNIVCFMVLVLFGVSLLGLFELRLPSSWANALDQKSTTTTGIVSIFLMALTMVVVSFSCTAPVMGLLLVEIAAAASADNSAVAMLTPVVGMTGFALALAMPFTLFALFPQWLKRVPKSGAWMTRVKVTLGFLEIAFAMKFLSVADLAYGWGILPRNVFLIVWIILALACGIYHGMDWQRRRPKALLRHKTAIVCYVFAAYLIPGLWGAPCTLVSAFLPPMEGAATGTVLRDYDEALLMAQRTGKPLFIDFTGYGCVNCRKMEAAVFTDARVQERLRNDFVVVQLFVDDRTPLPQPLQADGKTLRTVGDKWALLENHKFGSAAQPFYVITDSSGTPLKRSYAYDEDVERFLAWLRK